MQSRTNRNMRRVLLYPELAKKKLGGTFSRSWANRKMRRVQSPRVEIKES
jgi:hypothetical protein